MRRLCNILIAAWLLTFSHVSLAHDFATNSVLQDGTIYKIGVMADGVYRITFEQLAMLGVDVNTLDVNKISMFGNISGMLPEANNADFYDDLTEMDILVDDNGIVFYGENQHRWTVNSASFKYQTNYYSDTTFYFLKIDNQDVGKRMEIQPEDERDYLGVVSTFVDKQYHELNLHNHYHRGRKWYGEEITVDDGDSFKIPFVFKNIIANLRGSVEVSFVGATAVDGTYAHIKINGEQAGEDIRIAKAGQYNFAVEKTVEEMFTPVGDTVEVSLSVTSSNSASFLGLNYISVNACRLLRYEEEQLVFAVNRLSHPIVELVKVENCTDNAMILDVTSPLHPKIQEFSMIGADTISFKKYCSGENYFVLLNPDDVLDVVSMQRIDNQNVHSIAEAEMLIITDKVFAAQAEEIKTIHEESEGLLSVVVFIDEIYNEFSSGSLDISAIRNFIRMVYERSSNLKYVLLLGRGTNDYKNVEGYGGNFIPPYEATNSVNEIQAYVSDDYFGLMDENEGRDCAGKVDLGVGRMPVLTTDEAEVVVEKIIRYMDFAKTKGKWRNNMLILSDDSKNYSKSCDELEAIVDTKINTLNINKIYADSYVRVKLSDGSYCYPDVTSSIINSFNEGIIMMTYLGHGGVKGLSASNIFKIKDIEALQNYYKLAFVVTGTCEFSAFDDASFVSAGERLYTMENGGAIGMFTTARPTQPTTNKAILKTFVDKAFGDNNIKTLAMGDIVRMTKFENSSNSSNFLSYVFFGDPALRFAYPEERVMVSKINGNQAEIEVHVAPMDSIRVEGWVSDANGIVDETFNGVVYPKMFDNKSTFTTLNNQGIVNNVFTYTNYSDVLYEGGFSVVNGRFSCVFKVPRSVNNQSGNAKLSFYAVDTINYIDANGFFNNIIVDEDPTVTPGFEGPEINLAWDDGHLSATLHDTYGFYHYGSVIGRDMMLLVESDNDYKSLIVNDYFEQTVDDFTSGTIEIDLDLLEVGENVISLRAWNTHDISNTASITVNKAGNQVVTSMKNVVNYPNPFSESTCFTIEYDKENVSVDVSIHIYDVAGRLVNILEYNDLTSGILNMEWNGIDASGNHLASGVYIYKVYLKDSDGCEHNTSQRMIILK